MKLMLLVVITFVQLTAFSAVRANVLGPESVTLAQADLGGTQGIQRIQEGGDGDKKLDINVTVGDPMPMHSRMWYAQPIWIAVFVIGGVVLLTLLAMAFRGQGSGGTIVKG